jgi:hypothetical protein
MDLPLFARNGREFHVRGSCNHFAVTADKWLCVVNGFDGLSLCVCLYIYVYIYIYKKITWAYHFEVAIAAKFSFVVVAIISP